MICLSPRSGFLRPHASGTLSYSSFVPASLPPRPALELEHETANLLERARRELAHLEVLRSAMPDTEPFFNMLLMKEALSSARIEGSRVTLDELLSPVPDAGASEVLDLAEAHRYAVRIQPPGAALSLRLLREAHAVLFAHDGRTDRTPGAFRTTQNWIGPRGSSLRSATFVPPDPGDMAEAVDKLELFIQEDRPAIDPLVLAALIHYQFVTIHPFSDGNGRMGRLLTVLFLLNRKVIPSPGFPLSSFLLVHRTEYVEHLMSVRQNGTYEAWVAFFLKAVLAAALDAADTIAGLVALRRSSQEKILRNVRGKAARERRLHFLSCLEKQPVMDIRRGASDLGWTFPTVSKFVHAFVEAGILKETTGKARGRVFAYEDCLAILRRDTAPL